MRDAMHEVYTELARGAHLRALF